MPLSRGKVRRTPPGRSRRALLLPLVVGGNVALFAARLRWGLLLAAVPAPPSPKWGPTASSSSPEVEEGMCLVPDHDAGSSSSTGGAVEVGMEYLPPPRAVPCSSTLRLHPHPPPSSNVVDPAFAKSACGSSSSSSLGPRLTRTLSSWHVKIPSTDEIQRRTEGKATTQHLIKVWERGFFSMVHMMVDQMIDVSLEGGLVYLRPLSYWAQDGTSFQSWIETPPTEPGTEDGPTESRERKGNIFGAKLTGGDAKRNLERLEPCKARCSRTLDRFAAVSAVVSAFLRPLPPILNAVQERKNKLGWTEHDRVVGLYVRRGDSCTEDQVERTKRRCDDLPHYMDDVRRVAGRYGIKKVYLLSDGGDYVYNQTDQYPEFQWMYEPMVPKPKDEAVDFRIRRTGGLDEGTEVLIDFLTLTSADALVGKHTSNMFRAAVEYASGRRGERVPFVSLDAPWCHCYGRPSPIERGPFAGDTFNC